MEGGTHPQLAGAGRRVVAVKEVYRGGECITYFPYRKYNKIFGKRSLAWALSTQAATALGSPDTAATLAHIDTRADSNADDAYDLVAGDTAPTQVPVQEEPQPSATVSDMARFWGPLWDAKSQAVVPSAFEPIERMRTFDRYGQGYLPRDHGWRSPSPTPTLYEYRPLEGNRSIRILCLEPGFHGDKLHFHLEHTALSRPCHDYDALSYAWGSGRWRHDSVIYNSEGVISISATLEEALRRIRRTDEPRYVWVDSVCINQQDEVEKGRQVGLMCDIYRRAKSVLVWLGGAKLHQAIGAFSILAAVASHGQVAGRPLTGKAHFISNGVPSIGILGLPGQDGSPPPLESDLWRFVADLFERPWFSRVWCVQEIALARTATVMWGDAEMSWRWLGLAAARIRVNLFPLIARYDLSGLFNAYLMYRLSQGDAEAEPAAVSFLELLAMTCQFGVSDSRDRVYGLLGLPTTNSDLDSGSRDNNDNNSRSNKLLIEPDYTLKWPEVYWNVAVKVLQERQKNMPLKILCAVQHSHRIHRPSWVPWWNEIHMSMITQFTSNRRVEASADIEPDYELVEDAKALRVRGICLGTVTERFGSIPPLDLVTKELDGWRKPKAPKAEPVGYNSLTTLFHRIDKHLSNSDTGTATEEHDIHGNRPEPPKAKTSFVIPFFHLSDDDDDTGVVLTTTPNITLSKYRDAKTTTPTGPPHKELLHTQLRDPDSQRYLCCTLTAGRNWQGVSVLDSDSEQHVADFVAYLHESPDTRGLVPLHQGGDSSRFAEAMRNVTKGRRLFTMEAAAGAETGRAQVGLGPDLIQPDDLICLLFGCPVPLCLRYEAAGFSLVGECYLHNYMQMEGVELLRKGELRSQVFEIH